LTIGIVDAVRTEPESVEMRKTMFGLAVAAAILLAWSRDARACGRGGYGSGGGLDALIAIVVATAAVDVGFTLWDAGSALASHHPSTAYGVVELVVAVPQLAFGIASTRSPGSSDFTWVYTAWMAVLTAHGIWTVATAGAHERPPTTLSRSAISARDTLSATEQHKRSGLVLSLGPTYVPLGDGSHPGVGLIGRF
jgi:hypothetical protein